MSIAPRAQERELWPDIMRGILILLVLFHHSAAWGKLLYTPFFMTGFFFISGYFHSDSKPFLPFLVAKFKGIIIPALTLGFASLFILKGLSVFDCSKLCEWFIFGYAYWFLFCLFVAHLLQYILVRFFCRNHLLLILSASMISIVALYFSHHARIYPWHAQVACVMQAPMMLGYLSRKANWFKISRPAKMLMCGSFTFIYTVLFGVAFFVVHMPWCDLIYNDFGNIYFFLPLSLLGTLSLAYFSAFIAENQKLIPLIGRHTLVIYITHGVFFCLVMGGTSVLFRDIAHMPWRPVDHTHQGAWSITCFIAICFATGAGVALSMLLHRYAPWVLGKFSLRQGSAKNESPY